jgi:hypothetical protein
VTDYEHVPHRVVDAAAAAPTSYNLTLTLADTEYSQAFPVNCRFIEFQARTMADVRFAFTTGKVAGPTADPGNIWVDTIGATNFTVNCRNDPGASNLDFGWHIRVR